MVLEFNCDIVPNLANIPVRDKVYSLEPVDEAVIIVETVEEVGIIQRFIAVYGKCPTDEINEEIVADDWMKDSFYQ